MAHGDAREGKWRRNWRMEWVASTLHTTTEHGVSGITTADVHTSAASSRLNWRPRRFKWTRPFRRKTKSGFCACAITFQTQSKGRITEFDRIRETATCNHPRHGPQLPRRVTGPEPLVHHILWTNALSGLVTTTCISVPFLIPDLCYQSRYQATNSDLHSAWMLVCFGLCSVDSRTNRNIFIYTELLAVIGNNNNNNNI